MGFGTTLLEICSGGDKPLSALDSQRVVYINTELCAFVIPNISFTLFDIL